jgi:NTE family protein
MYSTPKANVLNQSYIFPEKIQNSDVTFGIVTASQGSMKGVEVVANKLEKNLIPQYILASASAWPIFPVCKIGDKSFVDGGYYDNLPINYAFRLGSDEVVAIDLNVIPIHPEYMKLSNVKYIKPTRSLGGFMRYDHKQIMNNMTLGYLDTLKAYGRFMGYRHCFYKDELPNLNLKNLFSRIIEIYSHVSKNQIKQSKKADYSKTILDFYQEFTDGKTLSDLDYFIRSLEVFADLFDISFYEAHHPIDLLNDLTYLLNAKPLNNKLFDGFDKLKNIDKKRSFIEKLDDIELLRYLFSQIIDNIHVNITVLALIYSTKMKVLVCYLLLEFSMKEGILYDFHKED